MFRSLTLAFVLSTLACASDDDPVTAVSDGEADNYTSDWMFGLTEPERVVWLFLVDDADTEAARRLRETVANAFRLPDGPFPSDASQCPGDARDPSHEDPIDIRVIVAHPGQAAGERLVTPHELPGLGRLGERDDQTAHALWATAVKTELQRAPVSAAGGYAPFETVADTLSLLAGQRLPRTLFEEQQLQSLGADALDFVEIFYLSTRDDASPLPPSAYDVTSYCDPLGNSAHCFNFRELLLGQDGKFLLGVGQATTQQQPRNAEYLSHLDAHFALEPADNADQFFNPILFTSVGSACWKANPHRRSDGSVECRVEILLRDLSPCDPSRGWLDPTTPDGAKRAPKTEIVEPWGEARVCELRQLEGDALQRCLLHPEEQQYVAGFCYPEPSAECLRTCGADSALVPQTFRFVAGATRVSGSARLRYSCRFAEAE